ncbi:MAG: tRNA (adenosine(37)-N6)-threonylcarbamoyltransferase complex ATPase subunit type 1 TsaE [Oleiphilaceae bacterium]|nr:tRNA (adenosine(37)-N6)-threonylcarbamoyltransferase complex ATPase subunit type 1 TsaE [Oleiphilaceae bacterium]
MSSESLPGYWLPDPAATETLGAALGRVMAQGGVLYLAGDLGAGKTSLSRGLIQSLGHQGAVKSPTYTLVEPYEHLTPVVYHFDLYRLGDPEELEYMGIRDYFRPGVLCLVEWPARGEGFLPPADLVLTLSARDHGRQARFSVPSRSHGKDSRFQDPAALKSAIARELAGQGRIRPLTEPLRED